jgi:hypothetical protein
MGVEYLTFSKVVCLEMSTIVFILCVNFFGSFIILLFIGADQEEPLKWNNEPYEGMFG